MLKIRLQRVGKKNDPSFRLVLIEHKVAARSGKAKEVLGFHDFRKDGTVINKERVTYWLGHGVQLSDTAHNLLVTNKVIEGKKKNVLPKKTVPKKEEAKEEIREEAKVEAKPEAKVEEKAEEPAPVEVPTETPAEEAPAA